MTLMICEEKKSLSSFSLLHTSETWWDGAKISFVGNDQFTIYGLIKCFGVHNMIESGH